MGSIQFLPTNIIPSLDEIVTSHSLAEQPGPYSKASFLEFLRMSHCVENLELIVDVDKYVSRFAAQENMPFLDDEAIVETLNLVQLWRKMYATYISRTAPKEVNVSRNILDHFLVEMLPEPKELLVLREAVYELLSANYNDFIATTRELQKHRRLHLRRLLEIVAPDRIIVDSNLTADAASLDTLFKTISPDLLAQWEKTLEVYETLQLAISCDSSRPQSRANSAGAVSTRPSSRGSSIGSVFDNIREYSGWKKTVRILRGHRTSSAKSDQLSL